MMSVPVVSPGAREVAPNGPLPILISRLEWTQQPHKNSSVFVRRRHKNRGVSKCAAAVFRATTRFADQIPSSFSHMHLLLLLLLFSPRPLFPTNRRSLKRATCLLTFAESLRTSPQGDSSFPAATVTEEMRFLAKCLGEYLEFHLEREWE